MKKLLIISAVILSSLGFFKVVSAAGGNRWDQVWAAIDNLQEQISNISLIPGPQGEPGSVGPQGPAGSSIVLNRANVYKVTVTRILGPREHGEAVAACEDSNDILLSGGHDRIAPERSEPLPYFERQSWVVSGLNNSDSPWEFASFALCYRVD